MKTNLLILAFLAIALGVLGLFAFPRRAKPADPTTTEPMTFDEFVQYGRDNGGNIVGGMPWSFQFHGHPVSHENYRCYLIGAHGVRFEVGDTIRITTHGDAIIDHANGITSRHVSINPCLSSVPC